MTTTTLQEYINKKYPTKESRQKIKETLVLRFFGEEMNSRFLESVNNGETRPLEEILVFPSDQGLKESSLDLSDFTSLEEIVLSGFGLTKVDFLNTIPNPKKVSFIDVNGNNIKPTDIEIFSRFVNVKSLMLGTAGKSVYRNRFYGSFKSFQNLTKLESICIEATDVNRGLEYLPTSLVEAISQAKPSPFLLRQTETEARYKKLECSPHDQEVGCKHIQNTLRPYDYDLEAWQLAHPHKMYEARPELFEQPKSRGR
jgi:hypothetical protein